MHMHMHVLFVRTMRVLRGGFVRVKVRTVFVEWQETLMCSTREWRDEDTNSDRRDTGYAGHAAHSVMRDLF